MGIFDGLMPVGTDNGIYSVTTGLVKDNWDKEHPGMIKAEYFLGTSGRNVTGWIPVAAPYAFKECGIYMLPEIGSEVIIAFNMGDRNCPVVIGSLWNQKNTLPKETAVEKNTIKRIKTKGGCEVVFDDEEGKASVLIQTPEGLHLKIEDENQKITVQDKDGKNGMLLQAKEGSLTICAEKKITMKVGNEEMFTLDGNSKAATLKAGKVKAEASQGLELEGQNTKLEGSMLEVKGQSSLKVQSGGIAEVKGAMVKIN